MTVFKMGFNSIINNWRASGRAHDADHASKALATLQSVCTQTVKNLNKDPHITDSLRDELLTNMLKCSPSKSDSVEKNFTEFCRSGKKQRGKKQIGPIDNIAYSLYLGHVEPRLKLEKHLTSSRMPYHFRKKLKNSLSEILQSDLQGQKDLLDSIPLSKYPMWSFYDAASKTDPFANPGKNRKELRRRLGLGRLDLKDEIIILAHQLPNNIEPHVPTTFDAEVSKYFRPGGRTKPLRGPKSDGFPEVFHDPVSGQHLVDRIQEAL